MTVINHMDRWKKSYKLAQHAQEQGDYETARTGYLRALAESSHLPAMSKESIGLKLGLVGTLCSQGELKLALRMVKDTRKSVEAASLDDVYGLEKMERAIVFLLRSQPARR